MMMKMMMKMKIIKTQLIFELGTPYFVSQQIQIIRTDGDNNYIDGDVDYDANDDDSDNDDVIVNFNMLRPNPPTAIIIERV